MKTKNSLKTFFIKTIYLLKNIAQSLSCAHILVCTYDIPMYDKLCYICNKYRLFQLKMTYAIASWTFFFCKYKTFHIKYINIRVHSFYSSHLRKRHKKSSLKKSFEHEDHCIRIAGRGLCYIKPGTFCRRR